VGVLKIKDFLFGKLTPSCIFDWDLLKLFNFDNGKRAQGTNVIA
jgi:hypothetical protein